MDSRHVMVRWLACVATWLVLANFASAQSENLREPEEPTPCFLYCYGKGPFGFTELKTEFRLAHLNQKEPYVDDTKVASPEAFVWIERTVKPEVEEEMRVQGRRLLRISYTDPERSTYERPNTIMIALETARKSDWYRPLFVAMPEMYRGLAISGNDIPVGYIATLEWSGTAADRHHVAFDLSGEKPKPVRCLSSGRIVRNEFDSDEAYQAALPLWDEEADLFAGILWDEDKSFGDELKIAAAGKDDK